MYQHKNQTGNVRKGRKVTRVGGTPSGIPNIFFVSTINVLPTLCRVIIDIDILTIRGIDLQGCKIARQMVETVDQIRTMSS